MFTTCRLGEPYKVLAVQASSSRIWNQWNLHEKTIIYKDWEKLRIARCFLVPPLVVEMVFLVWRFVVFNTVLLTSKLSLHIFKYELAAMIKVKHLLFTPTLHVGIVSLSASPIYLHSILPSSSKANRWMHSLESMHWNIECWTWL